MAALAATTVTLVACGDSNPASPSPSGTATVEGILLGQAAAFASSANGSASSASGPITVVVEGTDTRVTISGDGTFEVGNLAAGEITLVFLQNDTEIGRITLTVEDGTTVKIKVKLEESAIVLIEIEYDGDDTGEISATCAKVDVEIPPGHLPPPGECKIWSPSLPPGHQGPPGDCDWMLDQHDPESTCVIDHYGVVLDGADSGGGGGVDETCDGLTIPAGHLPPPGECKIWDPRLPAGQQGPPGSCNVDPPAGTCLIDHTGRVVG
jgi:hypothetical protein